MKVASSKNKLSPPKMPTATAVNTGIHGMRRSNANASSDAALAAQVRGAARGGGLSRAGSGEPAAQRDPPASPRRQRDAMPGASPTRPSSTGSPLFVDG